MSKAFVSIEIFSQLQGPMADLPNQIFALLSAYVSMQRIEAYLKEEEVEEWASTIKAKVSLSAPSPAVENVDKVGFVNAAFRWHSISVTDTSTEVATGGGSEATLTLLPNPLDIPSAMSESRPAQTSFLLGHLNLTFPSGRLSLITGHTSLIPDV